MMNTTYYARAGFFVVLLGSLAFFTGLWLWSKHGEARYETYVTYLDETVMGLNEDSTVRFNGVPVGFVKKIMLNPHDAQQVKVIMRIRYTVPITTATRAVLMSQGVTGLSYVELKTTERLAPRLLAKKGEPYPVIISEPSLIVELSDVARKITMNIDHLTKTLDKTSAQAEKTFVQTDLTMRNMADQAIPIFLQTMNHFNDTLINLKLLTDDMRQNPSMLIRGKSTKQLGPGEKP